jgi:hypothetical protein
VPTTNTIGIDEVEFFAARAELLDAGEGVSFSIGAWHTPVVRWGQEKINRYVEATRLP